MDISFTNESENIGLEDQEDIQKHKEETGMDVQHDRIALAEIQTNDKSNVQMTQDECSAIKNDGNTVVKGNSVPENGLQSADNSTSDLFKDVWGVHLNKSLNKANTEKNKLHKRTNSFNLSEKLFVGSKFNKRNPRKSRSFSRPPRRNLSDFSVHSSFDDSQDSQSFSQDSQSFLQEFSQSFTQDEIQALGEKNNFAFFSQQLSQETGIEVIKHQTTPHIKEVPVFEDHSKVSHINIIESPVRERNVTLFNSQEKYKVISDTSTIINQPVSAVHKALLTSHLKEKKLTPARMIDKGWLERCTQRNSLEHYTKKMNDSGIASMESSTVSEQASSREVTPKLMQCTDDTPSHNYNENSVSESDEDIIGNSEDECERRPSLGIKRLSFGTKRKLNLISRNSHEISASVHPHKKLKNDATYPGHDKPVVVEPGDRVVEIPSTQEMEKIAEAILTSEQEVSKRKETVSGKLSKKDIFEKKMASGQANENFVRINLKKKVYVRGKKNMNFSKYKKAEWKKKKRMAGNSLNDEAGSTDLKCFKCGEVGHFSRNCFSLKGKYTYYI